MISVYGTRTQVFSKILLIDGIEEEEGIADREQICQAFGDEMTDRRTGRATVLLLLGR